MPKPSLQQVPEYYHKYINMVNEEELLEALRSYHKELNDTLENLPEEKWHYAYAEGKWTIKELVQHIIDTERIFCYRALTFARKDDIKLPGFDENKFVITSKANNRYENDLIEELNAVQASSYWLFSGFDDEQLSSVGIANGNSISVLAIGFIIAGHSLHHYNILKERYL